MVCLENAEELSNKEPPITLAKTPCCNQPICTECFRGLQQPKKCPLCRKPLEYLHLLTFQMPIFNKPHKHLFLGFYYSELYLTVKNVKSTVRNFALRWSNLTQ